MNIREFWNDKFDSATKLKIYKFFGADFFQKVVFKVEKLKFFIIEKFFPNFPRFFEKLGDKYYDFKFKGKEDIERKRLYQIQKLKYRKELITNQNCNYHYNPDHPLEFIYYLKLNRKIHVRGIVSNVICIALIICASLLTSIPIAYIISLSIFELFSMIINFECINLQNYNLERFENERMKEILTKKEEKQIESELENYRNCSKVVSAKLLNSTEIPTVLEVADEIKTKEQADELKVMAARRLKKLEAEKKLRRK